MLSDAGGKIGAVYSVYDDEAGVDIRGRFLIDPDRVIQATEVLTPFVRRTVAELIRPVKAFQRSVTSVSTGRSSQQLLLFSEMGGSSLAGALRGQLGLV